MRTTTTTTFLASVAWMIVVATATATAATTTTTTTESSSSSAVATERLGPLKPARVTITNGLTDQLTVHCKSKDDDIGVKVLPTNASFAWHFNPSVLWNTLFFCSFDWASAGGLKWFDIYDEKRDLQRCRECKWLVAVDLGPCLYNEDTKAYDKCAPFRDRPVVVSRPS